MSTSLSLGKVDEGKMPSDKSAFLSVYHAVLDTALKAKNEFRDEGNNSWKPFSEVSGTGIRDLQQFLKDTGFMPKANVDGVFGYATQAAVRLFQEYIRTVEGDTSIGAPDGVVGDGTWGQIEKWKQTKQGKPEYKCEWARFSADNPTPEFNKWISLLEKAKQHYLANPSPILALIDQHDKSSDTRKVKDWDTSSRSIHLIGIRRAQETQAGVRVKTQKRMRANDDLFVLLINGMVFKFWGSTDPNPDVADRADVPFIIEGQHDYKFGWHKVKDATLVYRALRPKTVGVLVFRDINKDSSLTETDIANGLDKNPNDSINIHWSGIGSYNYSAGCQVLAGKSYINHKGEVVNCSKYAATKYSELGGTKGRGAYNMFADLVLSLAPEGVQSLVYTLGRDETLFLSDDWDENYVSNTLKKMM
ncbi:MAG: peptidoglycan-binding protein [Saprospiraceae bacterium]|nr:peptidoglycan-binding protein [Saprospiraceae bacterium]